MDLENIILSEINQSEKDKYHMSTHMWNQMNKLNLHARQRQTHRWRTVDSYLVCVWGEVRELRDGAKRKKDSWTWTTVW